MGSVGEERAARIVVLAATVWFALAVAWGLFSTIGGGHWAIAGSRGIMADNMLTWGIWGGVREYHAIRPLPQEYYVHHPWGTYWVIGLLMKVFGRHAFVPRLEPVLMSIACPPLLYGIGRVMWGPIPGALASLAFVVCPIALGFGAFPGFEVPLNFGVLLTTWGYVRFQERWKRRWMAVSLAGVVWSVNSDWESCVFLGVVLGVLLVTSYFLPRWFGRVDARRFGQWWSLAVIVCVLTVFAYIAYVKKIGNLDEFLNQETKRENGNELPLAQVLEVRSYWIDVSFTPLAITIGKIAAPIFAIRLLFARRPLEVFPLAILAMAAFEYVHFKNGADVHTFWPLPFAPYWALSVGVLGKVALDLARFTIARLPVSVPRDAASFGVLGCVGLLPLVILPDGIRGMNYARITGGRYNDRGRRIFQDADKSEAAAWFSHRMVDQSRVLVHASMHSTWAIDWALRRPTTGVDGVPTRTRPGDDRYVLVDMGFMKPADQQKMASDFHIVALNQYALVDRTAPAAPADGYVFDVREPNALEWYLYGPEPVRTPRADPWRTWELRDEFGQTPNPPPPLDVDPSSLEDLRIAHNVALATGDAARAEHFQAALVARLDSATASKFTDGTILLGEHFANGVAPMLDLYFQAGGPAAVDDLQFDIKSFVQSAPMGSLVPPDPKVKAAGMPVLVPPRLWKAGYIYADHTEIRHRPGRELFTGFFANGPESSRPKIVGGGDELLLLTVH
jgi:hypothetical protein